MKQTRGRERRDARYVKQQQKRARSSSGTKKGFKKHLFKVRIRGKQRQRCEE